MKDNEIIEAIEYCMEQGITSECERCTDKIGCRDTLLHNALNLINRQKAEIERLQKAIKVQDIMIEQQDYKIKKAETEARKEFAEKLESRCAYKLYEQNGKPTSDRAILVSDMNKLLTEMESGRR